jgi:hypothetical protein
MCDRNINGGIDNPNLVPAEWTIDGFKMIFDKEVLNQITAIHFCGVFGEPILNNDLIDMCEYTKNINPDIFIGIYTNGSARNSDWWISLAKALPVNHKVEFALDGLSDTHSLYRVGTSFEKIIDNAKTFIEAGGIAHWIYIKFKHNQHQVEEASRLAKESGFSSFSVKNSKRFSNRYTVLDKKGAVSHHIEQPDHTIVKFIDKNKLSNYRSWPKGDRIDCFVLKDKEVYIDANYTMLPCCILASFLYSNYDRELYKAYNVYDESPSIDAGRLAQSNIYETIAELGGLENIDASKHGIKNIMQRQVWNTLWKNKWDNKESAACILLCSEDTPFISIRDQKVYNVSI